LLTLTAILLALVFGPGGCTCQFGTSSSNGGSQEDQAGDKSTPEQPEAGEGTPGLTTDSGELTPEAVKLTEADDGTTIERRAGEMIEISLASNPTTGYGWEVVAPAEPVIEQVGEEEYVPDETSNRRVGVGGTSTFRFKAVKAGQTPLKLVYRRSRETDVEPVKTFAVTVVVKE
jgi:inhibitor of cysteine peptidase